MNEIVFFSNVLYWFVMLLLCFTIRKKPLISNYQLKVVAVRWRCIRVIRKFWDCLDCKAMVSCSGLDLILVMWMLYRVGSLSIRINIGLTSLNLVCQVWCDCYLSRIGLKGGSYLQHRLTKHSRGWSNENVGCSRIAVSSYLRETYETWLIIHYSSFPVVSFWWCKYVHSTCCFLFNLIQFYYYFFYPKLLVELEIRFI